MNSINIVPVSLWTSSGVLQADTFEVRYISYAGGRATADCHLWSSAGPSPVEVSAQLVPATEAQCAAWTDDPAFFRVLAANAGLTPVV